eukprot:GHVR01063390.1.p1 GENE.GHVR01063390.1~~GHVR01063390.1.p1  ORF type:complete len:208 (-),score=65.00 GHVR01063390.1:48-671(-)
MHNKQTNLLTIEQVRVCLARVCVFQLPYTHLNYSCLREFVKSLIERVCVCILLERKYKGEYVVDEVESTLLTPLITHDDVGSTLLTPLITHDDVGSTLLTPLITHDDVGSTLITPLITHDDEVHCYHHHVHDNDPEILHPNSMNTPVHANSINTPVHNDHTTPVCVDAPVCVHAPVCVDVFDIKQQLNIIQKYFKNKNISKDGRLSL